MFDRIRIVDHRDGSDSGSEIPRIERALRRCLEWSRSGRHLKIINEVDRALPAIGNQPQLEAQLLIWKAQAHLAMGDPDNAHPAASRSWHLDPSSYACHLLSNALIAVGQADDAEELLRSGWDLFPDAYHLPVQLAILLSDQGRHPEALDTIDSLPRGAPVPDDLQVFLLGLHANLLAAVGRWGEADGILKEGRYRHPDSDLLEDAHHSLGDAWDRYRTMEALADSWFAGLAPLDGVASEVDNAIVDQGSLNELPTLVILGARRLWRAYFEAHKPRVQTPQPWGAALLAAILELDGVTPPIAAMARLTRSSVSTTRSALTRIRRFLGDLDTNLAHRAFAAMTNPQLKKASTSSSETDGGTVVPFPPR
jgi:tetratricopeptide (TPR) repeat protein